MHVLQNLGYSIDTSNQLLEPGPVHPGFWPLAAALAPITRNSNPWPFQLPTPILDGARTDCCFFSFNTADFDLWELVFVWMVIRFDTRTFSGRNKYLTLKVGGLWWYPRSGYASGTLAGYDRSPTSEPVHHCANSYKCRSCKAIVRSSFLFHTLLICHTKHATSFTIINSLSLPHTTWMAKDYSVDQME